MTILDAQFAWTTEIAICVFTVAKGEAVNIVVISEAGRSVVQEASYRTSTATVLVDDKNKTVELANSVDTRLANSIFAILDEPDLEIAASSFLTRGAKFELGRPFGVDNDGLSPCCTTRGARSGRSEDYAIREELGNVVLAGQVPARNQSSIGGDGSFLTKRGGLYHILR